MTACLKQENQRPCRKSQAQMQGLTRAQPQQALCRQHTTMPLHTAMGLQNM